jgi:hypothetical protein
MRDWTFKSRLALRGMLWATEHFATEPSTPDYDLR